MAKENLDHYLSLRYEIRIQEIEEDDEIGYIAFTDELNPDAFYGVGETEQEAINSFKDVKEELFAFYLGKGLEIPKPRTSDLELPSGRFPVRTSPELHLKTIKAAHRNKQSLNAYVNSLLEKGCSENIVLHEISSLKKSFKTLETEVRGATNQVFWFQNNSLRQDKTKMESENEYKATA